MSQWRLKIQDDDTGQARILFMEAMQTIGMATLSWSKYRTLVRRLTTFVYDISKTSIADSLERWIWQHALNRFENSPELAKAKLAEFGFNRDLIASMADEFSKELLSKLIEFLPEHS